MGTPDVQDAARSAVVWDRLSPTPWCAAVAPHVCDSPPTLDSVTRRSSDVHHHTACRCIADRVNASKRDFLHFLPVYDSSKLIGAIRPDHIVVHYGSADAQAQSTPASPQVVRPAFFFTQSNSTLSCPICWYNCAWKASWSCACFARRAEKISGISFWRRCFQWAICVGCTP